MFLSLFNRRLAAALTSTLMQANMRLYTSPNNKSHCPGPKPCSMGYPQKKCQDPECLPKEPFCPLAFTKSPSVKENLCQINPQCCDSKRLATNPCNCPGARQHNINKNLNIVKQIPSQSSSWEYPAECCANPCPDLMPSFDSLYYIPTDKAKRQYQQTWVECPAIQRRKRNVCCYDPTELPPICRRKKEECPISACEFDSRKLKALCSTGSKTKCPHITAPCCIRGRYPPTCRKSQARSNCKRKCCPYPAFSECCHACLEPKRPTECNCPEIQPNCVIYRHLKRKLLYDLPPPLPAWPPKMPSPR